MPTLDTRGDSNILNTSTATSWQSRGATHSPIIVRIPLRAYSRGRRLRINASILSFSSGSISFRDTVTVDKQKTSSFSNCSPDSAELISSILSASMVSMSLAVTSPPSKSKARATASFESRRSILRNRSG